MGGSISDPTWRRAREGRQAVGPLLERERVVDAIRAFFKARRFNEVETPLLVRHPGMEPHLEPFESALVTARGQRARAFLTTSPEYAMKKLLAAGLERIFQVCKAFRNREEVSSRHNPEFTILEWYRANADYRSIMDDCEELLIELRGGEELVYQGERVDLSRPWERLSVREAFRRHAGIELDECLEREGMVGVARARGYAVEPDTSWEQLYHELFLNEVEPRLGGSRPTILYDYPVSMAALARAKPDDRRYAERFELYVAGVELGNAFGELTDPVEQRRRLELEREERRAAGRTLYDLDEDFLDALDGVPPSAGIAVGVDRLVMLLTDQPSIRDVLWFPADQLFDVGNG
jgi:elongation factor P--(R)-beta-lysine ligase